MKIIYRDGQNPIAAAHKYGFINVNPKKIKPGTYGAIWVDSEEDMKKYELKEPAWIIKSCLSAKDIKKSPKGKILIHISNTTHVGKTPTGASDRKLKKDKKRRLKDIKKVRIVINSNQEFKIPKCRAEHWKKKPTTSKKRNPGKQLKLVVKHSTLNRLVCVMDLDTKEVFRLPLLDAKALIENEPGKFKFTNKAAWRKNNRKLYWDENGQPIDNRNLNKGFDGGNTKYNKTKQKRQARQMAKFDYDTISGNLVPKEKFIILSRTKEIEIEGRKELIPTKIYQPITEYRKSLKRHVKGQKRQFYYYPVDIIMKNDDITTMYIKSDKAENAISIAKRISKEVEEEVRNIRTNPYYKVQPRRPKNLIVKGPIL